MEKEDILNIGSEYITELYHDDRGLPPIINNNEGPPPILEEEVQKALKKMKKGKATGPDEISSAMLTAVGEFGIKEITKLLNILHDADEIPTDLKIRCTLQYPKQHVQLNLISTAQ